MPKALNILILLIILSACREHNPTNANKPATQSHKKPAHTDTLPNGKLLFDTSDSAMVFYYKEVVGSDTLKGGAILCYGTDDSMRYLYLRRGNVLHELNRTSVDQSPWSVGTLDTDFGSFILTRIDNGNSTPASYQAFDKTTSKNLLGENGLACSYNYFKDTLFVLCAPWAAGKRSDKISLLNVSTGKKQAYTLPRGLPENCDIQIDKISSDSLRLSFENMGGEGNFEKVVGYGR